MEIHPIGKIISPYRSNFGIPRQSGLITCAQSAIELTASEEHKMALRGLEEYSHIWILFQFHKLKRSTWKPLVQPPRLGGKKKIGVFATRSPYHPNSIGISVVRLVNIEQVDNDKIHVNVTGGDLLHGTPVIDIKPYIPYADSIADVCTAWATPPKISLKVGFTTECKRTLKQIESPENLEELIIATLALDPRPGYERGNSKVDGQTWITQLYQFDIVWTVEREYCEVLAIKESPEPTTTSFS